LKRSASDGPPIGRKIPRENVETIDLSESLDHVSLTRPLGRLDLAVIVWDGEERIRLADNGAVELLGMPLSDLIGSNILSFAQSIQDSRHTIEDVRNGRYEWLSYTRTLKKLDGIPITVDAATRIFQIDGLAIAVTACGPQAGPNSGGGHPLRTWLGIVPIVVGIANKNWTIEVVSGDALSLIGRSVDASDATLLSSFTRPTPTQLERQQGDPQLFPQVFRGSGSSDPTELKCRAMLFSAFQPQDLSRSSSVPSVILTTCFLGLWIASRNLRCVFAESGLFGHKLLCRIRSTSSIVRIGVQRMQGLRFGNQRS
jgi:PAS domain-containing protein